LDRNREANGMLQKEEKVYRGRVIRLREWEEFKNLASKSRTDKVVYNIEQGKRPLHLTSLRLILPLEGVQYIFLDFSRGDRLRQTGIALHIDEAGVRFIKDQDVVDFLKRELGNPDLKISSFWTM